MWFSPTRPGFKSWHGKFFANLPDFPPSRIMPIFQKMTFCPSNSETQTFRHVQCAEPWRLEWCVLIPEAVTQETNFLIPKMHCLNKLRGKSRTGIDCVGFCAWWSAVSWWDSFIFTTTLARACGRPISRFRASDITTKNKAVRACFFIRAHSSVGRALV